MRDVSTVPDECIKMFDASIQEVNGKGPKKRKKSLEHVCDEEQGSELNAGENEKASQITVGEFPATATVELLHWRDMPKHLQFNPYVLTGYRPLQDWSGCVRSLFYFHNETINILTHGVSLVYMMLVLPGLLPWSGGGSAAWFLSLCHLLGALAPWCGSFLYHLFMNHTSGAALYHRLLQLDMLGIWVSQSIGAIPMVTATVYCAPALLRYTALAVYCLGSLIGLYKAMRAWSPWERRLCFAAPFCMRLLLAGARAARLGGGDPHAILHVFYKTRYRWGRSDRCHAHSREVVPRYGGPLPKLAQHHARAGRTGGLLNASGDYSRPGLDVSCGLSHSPASALTLIAVPRTAAFLHTR